MPLTFQEFFTATQASVLTELGATFSPPIPFQRETRTEPQEGDCPLLVLYEGDVDTSGNGQDGAEFGTDVCRLSLVVQGWLLRPDQPTLKRDLGALQGLVTEAVLGAFDSNRNGLAEHADQIEEGDSGTEIFDVSESEQCYGVFRAEYVVEYRKETGRSFVPGT